MILSCKITATILAELDSRSEDVCAFFAIFDNLPESQLRDPTAWLPALVMELFLEQVTRFPWNSDELHSLTYLATTAPYHRSWGILDSVLRMMSRTEEIWAQPTRLLANFIQPESFVQNISRHEEGISFLAPLSAEQYPHICEFLTSCFEILPIFIGSSSSQCHWKSNKVTLSWSLKQKSFLTNTQDERVISPELIQSILQSLDCRKEEVDSQNIEKVRQNLARLSDYWTRAQQLVVLLSAQSRQTLEVQEAMRRTNWSQIQKEFREICEDSRQLLAQKQESSVNNKNLNSKIQTEKINPIINEQGSLYV